MSLMNGINETKKRLSESRPALYAFITVALSMLSVVVISYLVQSLGSIAVMVAKGSVSPKDFNNIGDTASNLLSLLGYLVVLLIYFRIYGKEITPAFFSVKGTGKGILMLWSVLIINAVTLLFVLMDQGELGSVWMALLLGLTPGITEEILCRIIPLSLVMRNPDRKKLMLPAVTFTSLIFGICHIVNIFSGADPVTTLFQVLYATGTGFLFGAVYIRTGNPWITIILHSMTDTIFFLRSDAQLSGGVLSQSTGSVDGIILLIYAVLYFLNAYLVFRKNKDGVAEERWALIWKGKKEVSSQQ